jgi:predicted ATPase/DNA-binding SARP family transcriptional activator
VVEVRVLGPVTIVSADGREWHLGTTREAAVLADLVVHAGEVVPVDRLVDDVWRGDPPPGATSTVQTYVKNLRRLIDPERGGRAPEQILVTARPGYVLRTAGDLVDADQAVRLVEEGRRALEAGDEHGAADRLREATRLWHGRPFGELAGESYLLAEATRLDELFMVATEERVEAELRLGLHGVLCGELETVVGAYPYRERLWGQLMLAFYRSGRQTDALRSYQRLRGTLADEIGIEPGETLRALEVAILRHDPTLDWRPRPPASPTDGGPAAHRGARRRESGRAAGRTRQSLPLALTRFVGRARERAELNDLLSGGSRLLTLTGVGGVGKTRLALESASDLAGRYLDGVRLFEFAPVNEEDGVLSALAATFGIYPKQGSDGNAVAELLCEHLSTRQLLLVFDNCEHVIEVVAQIVTAIAKDCAHVTILATSREPLRVPGEVVFAVPPLQLPDLAPASTADIIGADAIALFCDRARDARPDLTSTALDLPAVVRICRRLDGIPLALELAAARFRTLTLSQIADHLDQCLQLLVTGARTATPRQQTLKGALDWSYDLLPSTEQAGLRELSVFPGTFDLEAAAGVVAGDIADSKSQPAPVAALELISQLVDKSLVVADLSSPVARYRLLEPVRQYAAEKLASAGETSVARRRHRDHFAARALRDEARPDRLNTGPAGLADFDNYRAALERSWEHGDIEASLILIAPQSQARIDNRDLRVRQWLETILAEPEPSTHPARAQALIMLALIVQESAQPDPRRSRQLMADAMAVAGRLDDPIVTAYIQFHSAELHLAWGNSSQARALLTEAIEAYTETAPPATTGWCYEHLGWAAIIEGDLHAARAHFDSAATLALADTDGAWLLSHALAALAPVTAALGQPQQALVFADQALAAARRFAFPSVVIMALCRAAETALLAGSQRRAARLIAEMLGLARDRADQAWLADGLEMAALALDSRGDMSAAVAILNASEALRTAAGERPGGARPLTSKVDEARRRLLQVPQRKDNSEALLAFSPADATDYARALLDERAGPPL